MTSIPNSIPFPLLKSQPNHSLLPIPSISLGNALKSSILRGFRSDPFRLRLNPRRSSYRFCVRASSYSLDSGGDNGGVRMLKGVTDALPPAVLVVRSSTGSKYAVGIVIAFSLFAIVVRQVMHKKNRESREGSVADLVRRGQLRPDRRGIVKPLKYEDPFNNPLVKVSKSDSSIEMCGKVYRLAPITLTEEQQSEHQKRRSCAYQWKRPKVFLKEGDPIPPDVDPDTVRWVPDKHPFATTDSDIDEKIAHGNISQKHGVPSRIKAEHEALQKKLDTLQNRQMFNEGAINLKGIQGSEDANHSPAKLHECIEPVSSTDPDIGSNGNVFPDVMKRKI